MRQDTKLAKIGDTWKVGDHLVEQERVNDRHARWQFVFLVYRIP